jgi:hypothetical protein
MPDDEKKGEYDSVIKKARTLEDAITNNREIKTFEKPKADKKNNDK